jgi:AraC-like DNA-binding protein
MTQDASELTSGAKETSGASETPIAGDGTKVLATVVRSTVELAVAIGVGREALLERMGVQEWELSDPEHFVSLEAHMTVWDAIGEMPNAETLAFDLARAMRVDRLGVVGWAIQNAPTALDAILSIRRYGGLFGDPFVPRIESEPDVIIIHRAFEPRMARTRVMPEHAPAATLVLLRELTGMGPEERVAREVWFQHAPPRDPTLHEHFFGCPVRFHAPETRLVLERRAVERPLLKRDPTLYAYVDRHARALSERQAEQASLSGRVRQHLLEVLEQGEPRPTDVARALGTSERTLQRRLKEGDRTFSDILDDVRRELASSYLCDERLAIFEIAFLLGYSETSSFHRAFRRWTNMGPQEFRATRVGS